MQDSDFPMIRRTPEGAECDVVVGLAHGIHSRPSARIAQAARSFDAKVIIKAENGEVDASSMLDILSLTIPTNSSVTLLASGPQAPEALKEIAGIIAEPGV